MNSSQTHKICQNLMRFTEFCPLLPYSSEQLWVKWTTVRRFKKWFLNRSCVHYWRGYGTSILYLKIILKTCILIICKEKMFFAWKFDFLGGWQKGPHPWYTGIEKYVGANRVKVCYVFSKCPFFHSAYFFRLPFPKGIYVCYENG